MITGGVVASQRAGSPLRQQPSALALAFVHGADSPLHTDVCTGGPRFAVCAWLKTQTGLLSCLVFLQPVGHHSAAHPGGNERMKHVLVVTLWRRLRGRELTGLERSAAVVFFKIWGTVSADISDKSAHTHSHTHTPGCNSTIFSIVQGLAPSGRFFASCPPSDELFLAEPADALERALLAIASVNTCVTPRHNHRNLQSSAERLVC